MGDHATVPLPPFEQPTVAEYIAAQEIVDSHPVISAYASCEWDEYDENGQTWLAAIVREATRRSGGKAPRQVYVTMDTPVKWSAQTFFRATSDYAGGIVIAFAPTFFAIGIDLIRGSTRGVALMIGPLWLGFACRRFDRTVD